MARRARGNASQRSAGTVTSRSQSDRGCWLGTRLCRKTRLCGEFIVRRGCCYGLLGMWLVSMDFSRRFTCRLRSFGVMRLCLPVRFFLASTGHVTVAGRRTTPTAGSGSALRNRPSMVDEDS